MNRFFLAVVTCLLTLLFALPALAVEDAVTTEEPPQEPMTVETQADDKNIIVNVTLPAVTPSPTPSELPIESTEDSPVYSPYSTFALDEGSGGTPDTLAATVTALFGSYTPRTQTVTEVLPDGTSTIYTQIIPGLAGLDYPWLASAGLFSLFLYGLLRLLGGMVKL